MEVQNRNKLFGVFENNSDSVIYLKGGTVLTRYGTDFEYPFRQESNFLYLTGIQEPDFHVVLDLRDNSWILVIPRRDSKYALWHGYVQPESHYRETYRPDRIIYNDQLESYFSRRNPSLVYCLNNQQKAFIDKLGPETNTESLPEALAYCRSIKNEDELQHMRSASEIAGKAHRACMKAAQPGMMEYELKAVYEYENLRHGSLHPPYNGIFASGKSSAILHYVDNTRPVNDGDLVLIDAGAEINGYASDITRTWPANGKFNSIQADLYDTVLQALNETIVAARPGVKMEDLHLHASRIILEGLKSAGLLRGSIDDMMDLNIFALFFPHGLGHFLGLDTHDVGGYLKGVEPIDRPGLRFLRTRRTLEKGMVITIEPGIYFIPVLLKGVFQDKTRQDFLCIDKIKPLMDFGGIRIEDNLIITDSGTENMTDVPKARDEIEMLMAG